MKGSVGSEGVTVNWQNDTEELPAGYRRTRAVNYIPKFTGSALWVPPAEDLTEERDAKHGFPFAINVIRLGLVGTFRVSCLSVSGNLQLASTRGHGRRAVVTYGRSTRRGSSGPARRDAQIVEDGRCGIGR